MSLKDTIASALELQTTTISSGAFLSNAVNLGGLRLFGLIMPAAWDAAAVTVLASFDGGATWNNIYDAAGNEYTIIVGASRHVILDPTAFAAIPMIKIQSGTSASPVNQTADRAIQLILRSY